MKQILVTGATGFIGQAVVQQLLAQKHKVTTGVRKFSPVLPDSVTQIEMGDLSCLPENIVTLQGIDVVIHIAARAHIMDEVALSPLTEFRKVNTAGTLNLAKQAAEAGVIRFIFISSIKVNGEQTIEGKPFTPDVNDIPVDPYGLSKYEAEVGLRKISNKTGMEVVIIRPPLVYGPGVRANFLKMMTWVDKEIPLPFGAINNKRSLVALDNLVDLIVLCIDHPAAENQTFLVSDGDDVSTTTLLQGMAKALNKKALLIPVPVWMLKMGLSAIGKADIASRLCSSLQVDIKKTLELLDWTPPVSFEQGLQNVADSYVSEFGNKKSG